MSCSVTSDSSRPESGPSFSLPACSLAGRCWCRAEAARAQPFKEQDRTDPGAPPAASLRELELTEMHMGESCYICY